MKRGSKIFLGLVLFCALVLAGVITFCYRSISNNAGDRLYSVVDSLPHREVGLLLGAPPRNRFGDDMNKFCLARIQAAVELFNADKVDVILVSGSNDPIEDLGTTEVDYIHDALVQLGIPDRVIFIDGKGLRTLDSMVRTAKLHGVRNCTLISQKFHNERALFLADRLNLEYTDLIGYNAEDPHGWIANIVYIREWGARVKAYIDIILGIGPEYMDDPVEVKVNNLYKESRHLKEQPLDSIYSFKEKADSLGTDSDINDNQQEAIAYRKLQDVRAVKDLPVSGSLFEACSKLDFQEWALIHNNALKSRIVKLAGAERYQYMLDNCDVQMDIALADNEWHADSFRKDQGGTTNWYIFYNPTRDKLKLFFVSDGAEFSE